MLSDADTAPFACSISICPSYTRRDCSVTTLDSWIARFGMILIVATSADAGLFAPRRQAVSQAAPETH